VLRRLDASFKEPANAPHHVPHDWEPELCRQVGASSSTAFVNGTRLVLVAARRRGWLRRRHLYFVPTRLVPREGHSVIDGGLSESQDQTPEGIVQRLEAALMNSEPRPSGVPWGASAN
jgi:hypothetical protein